VRRVGRAERSRNRVGARERARVLLLLLGGGWGDRVGRRRGRARLEREERVDVGRHAERAQGLDGLPARRRLCDDGAEALDGALVVAASAGEARHLELDEGRLVERGKPRGGIAACEARIELRVEVARGGGGGGGEGRARLDDAREGLAPLLVALEGEAGLAVQAGTAHARLCGRADEPPGAGRGLGPAAGGGGGGGGCATEEGVVGEDRGRVGVQGEGDGLAEDPEGVGVPAGGDEDR